MQPRGQLWFELEKICKDFREFSGLEPRQALETLVVVLNNMLAEQKDALQELVASQPNPPSP